MLQSGLYPFFAWLGRNRTGIVEWGPNAREAEGQESFPTGYLEHLLADWLVTIGLLRTERIVPRLHRFRDLYHQSLGFA